MAVLYYSPRGGNRTAYLLPVPQIHHPPLEIIYQVEVCQLQWK